MTPASPLDVARHVAKVLDSAGYRYALGGAIALAYWAAPRATVDVDVGVDAAPMSAPDLVRVLVDAGFEIDEARALDAASRGDFGARYQGVRVDVFLTVLPMTESALLRRVEVPMGSTRVFILSAEDVALHKLLFGRTKDFADLERLFAVQGERLDFAYLDHWVSATFDEGDARVVRYRELRARFSTV